MAKPAKPPASNRPVKCSVCTYTHSPYNCVVDPCDDCGGRHVGPMPRLQQCALCGWGYRYPSCHSCKVRGDQLKPRTENRGLVKSPPVGTVGDLLPMTYSTYVEQDQWVVVVKVGKVDRLFKAPTLSEAFNLAVADPRVKYKRKPKGMKWVHTNPSA